MRRHIHVTVSYPHGSFNTAIGYPPMRHMKLLVTMDYRLFQYRNRVSPHAASPFSCSLLNTTTGFNTAIGYPPMRRGCFVRYDNIAIEFQYRNRVSPHAARSNRNSTAVRTRFNTAIGYPPMRHEKHHMLSSHGLLFQYRNRVSPHAASRL